MLSKWALEIRAGRTDENNSTYELGKLITKARPQQYASAAGSLRPSYRQQTSTSAPTFALQIILPTTGEIMQLLQGQQQQQQQQQGQVDKPFLSSPARQSNETTAQSVRSFFNWLQEEEFEYKEEIQKVFQFCHEHLYDLDDVRLLSVPGSEQEQNAYALETSELRELFERHGIFVPPLSKNSLAAVAIDKRFEPGLSNGDPPSCAKKHDHNPFTCVTNEQGCNPSLSALSVT